MTELVVLIILAAVAFLGGMAMGILVQEASTRQRERRIAAQRRHLAEESGEFDARRRGAARDMAGALPQPRRPLVIDQSGDIVQRV